MEFTKAVTSDKIDFTTLKVWTPDYSNQVDLGRIAAYTATERGWVCAAYYGYSTTSTYTAVIKVNGKTVYSDTTEATSPNGARASQGIVMVPVCSGDEITGLSPDISSSYFIPGKWT